LLAAAAADNPLGSICINLFQTVPLIPGINAGPKILGLGIIALWNPFIQLNTALTSRAGATL
jgi:hypothetical protein